MVKILFKIHVKALPLGLEYQQRPLNKPHSSGLTHVPFIPTTENTELTTQQWPNQITLLERSWSVQEKLQNQMTHTHTHTNTHTHTHKHSQCITLYMCACAGVYPNIVSVIQKSYCCWGGGGLCFIIN